MNPIAVKAAYVRALASTAGPGELVTLIRAGNATAYRVHGWLTDFIAADLAGGVEQGKRTATVLASDVVSSGFPLPFLPKQDRLKWGTKTNVISRVDDATIRIQGQLVAYKFDLEGA